MTPSAAMPPRSGTNGAFAGDLLTADNLVKIYVRGERPALDGLSFEVRSGEIFGLLGPNGAGKTTAISILSTILPPSRGTVRLHGVDIRKNLNSVRRKIGLVPQNIALYPTLTAAENLRYFGRLQGLWGRRLARRIRSVLEWVGLSAGSAQRVSAFSGGMQRRLNLAAGMLHGPELLFLDEPTVGIDAQSRSLIFEKLAASAQAGAAIVYSTHYMEEAESLCQRVLIIDNGRAVVQGPPDELIAQTPGCRNLGEVFLHWTGRRLRD